MFEDAEWTQAINGQQTKTITGDDFYNAGLSGAYEFGEKYNDIIYARQIFQKMGYSVYIGIAFHITTIKGNVYDTKRICKK